MNWLPVIAMALGGGGLAGLIGSLIAGLVQRPKVRADAVGALTEAAMKQVNELQERTASAEGEADRLRGKLLLLSREVDALTLKLRAVRMAILDPAATLPRLRSMVESDN